jgi:hypothetical protein
LSDHGREAVLKHLKNDPHVVLTAVPA